MLRKNALRTDGRTDKASYRYARTHLKIKKLCISLIQYSLFFIQKTRLYQSELRLLFVIKRKNGICLAYLLKGSSVYLFRFLKYAWKNLASINVYLSVGPPLPPSVCLPDLVVTLHSPTIISFFLFSLGAFLFFSVQIFLVPSSQPLQQRKSYDAKLSSKNLSLSQKKNSSQNWSPWAKSARESVSHSGEEDPGLKANPNFASKT